MPRPPAAFLSYVQYEDQHEEGRITALRKRLEGEIRIYTGQKDFAIFQDRAIGWGEEWQTRIDGALDGTTFFIPIVTPLFFESDACRAELERFLKREEVLQRSDLILPIYYVNTKRLNDPAARAKDPLAEAIAARQRVDWRELRLEPPSDPRIGKLLASMAEQVLAALERPHAKSAANTPGDPPPGDAPPRPTESQGPSGPPGGGAASEPTAKVEPPTHVVDLEGGGDFTSISAAVEAANPGDRILVRPGRYEEGIAVDKPLEILGDGPLEEVVVRALGASAITFSAASGRIVNLTLRQLGGGDFFGVNIAGGALDLEGCDISSRGLACVGIQTGANPTLSRNQIHHGKAQGVLVVGHGRVTLEGNEIFGNGLSGVEMQGTSRTTLRRNQIHSGVAAGVSVSDGGRGILEENDIFANAGHGVTIGGSSSPTLRRNRIHHGRANGVVVNEDSQGILDDNEIFANATFGVWIGGGSAPTVRENHIHDNVNAGICVTDGQGTLEGNEISSNAHGIYFNGRSSPTVRRNWIHENKTYGLQVSRGANPVVSHNQITRHSAPAICILDAGGTFQGNDLRGNAGGAWYLDSATVSKVVRLENIET